MHYTTVKPKSGDPINPDEVYVPGHSLGHGWTRHIAEIGDGDTHVNFASTKGPIYGPALVVTDISPSGITQRIHDDAAGFYASLRSHELLKQVHDEWRGLDGTLDDRTVLDIENYFKQR